MNFGYLICNIPALLLLFRFDEIRTVGYANVIIFIIFTILYVINLNVKRDYRDTLAVDYTLVTVLLPFQLVGRVIGASLNAVMPYYSGTGVTVIYLAYLIFKLFYRGTNEYKAESAVIASKQSEKFISLKIMMVNEMENQVQQSNDSSLSSFSVNSDADAEKMKAFEIEEASHEDDSSHRINTLHFPNDLSIEHSHRSKHVDDQFGLLSDKSSLDQNQRERYKEQQQVLADENSHFKIHNLFFILKCIILSFHWFYQSYDDPKAYSECQPDNVDTTNDNKAVDCD